MLVVDGADCLRCTPRLATSYRMRGVIVLFVLASAWSIAAADPKAEPPKVDAKTDAKTDAAKPAETPAPPRTPGPHDAKVKELLDKIVAGPDSAARSAAIDALNKEAPLAVEALGDWLARTHTADVETRRTVLVAIDAAVPDAKGRFPERKRQTTTEQKKDDEVDWLKALLALDPKTPGLGEVIADIAAIRALSATKDIRAAQLIFDAAFREETMIYRDECGRFMRKMEAYAIPALTRESQGKFDRRRYATWQLERLDRQDPLKALNAATGNEQLQIAILDVFRETKLREAVFAVWTRVNDEAPRVRAAARKTWMGYITGKPPRKAPTKKIMMPGGKLTEKEKPLWLTYRELADTQLRKAANELLHEDYPIEDEHRLDDKKVYVKKVTIDLVEVTNRLFAYYDGERAKHDATQWGAAKAKADGGDLAAATTMLDRLIAVNPERAERAEMAKIYVAWAKQLEKDKKWAEAAAAYSKAHGLDAEGAGAKKILAAHHYALGKSLEAQGKDGGPEYRAAVALVPDYAPAEEAAERTTPDKKRPRWMLVAAGFAGLAAIALFAMAMLRRRVA